MLQRALGQCRDSMQTDDGHIIRLNAPTRDFSFLFLPPGSNGDPNLYNGEEFVCMCGACVQCVCCVTGRRAGMLSVCAEDKFQVWKNSFGLCTRTTEQHVPQDGGRMHDR